MQYFIFLDVDGVLNHNDWYYENRVVKQNYKCGDFDPHCIELLNQLEGAEVVISSSWGEDADKPLVDLGLKLPIVGHIVHTLYYDHPWICRGNCIAKWLYENDRFSRFNYSGKYVIFDDDDDMLLSQVNNLIKVDSQHGLSQEDIDRAKIILDLDN